MASNSPAEISGGVPEYRVASLVLASNTNKRLKWPIKTKRRAPDGSGRTVKFTEGCRPFPKF